jgi:hypothetical protein
MTQRGAGFKQVEDILLCNAYIRHSTNSKIRTYQTRDDMWAKIEVSYNNEVVDTRQLEHRNIKSLSCRWERISAACTLFRSCVTQADRFNQSGSSDVDKVNILLNYTCQ